MPTYDYECNECKHRFEMFHSIKESPVGKCKKCGGSIRKLIGAGAGIIFKGSGFYVNDYKKSNAAANEASRKDSGSSSSSISPKPTPAASTSSTSSNSSKSTDAKSSA